MLEAFSGRRKVTFLQVVVVFIVLGTPVEYKAATASETAQFEEPWRMAVLRTRASLGSAMKQRGAWVLNDRQPISCSHIMFRKAEQIVLMKLLSDSVSQLSDAVPIFDLQRDMRRLVGRALVDLENYSAPIGKASAQIAMPRSGERWIAISYHNTVEVAELRGAQISGVNFKINGREVEVEVPIPIDAVCDNGSVDIYTFRDCLTKTKLASDCTPSSRGWCAFDRPSNLTEGSQKWPQNAR